MLKYKITVLYDFKDNETHFITSKDSYIRLKSTTLFYDELGHEKMAFPNDRIIIKSVK